MNSKLVRLEIQPAPNQAAIEAAPGDEIAEVTISPHNRHLMSPKPWVDAAGSISSTQGTSCLSKTCESPAQLSPCLTNHVPGTHHHLALNRTHSTSIIWYGFSRLHLVRKSIPNTDHQAGIRMPHPNPSPRADGCYAGNSSAGKGFY